MSVGILKNIRILINNVNQLFARSKHLFATHARLALVISALALGRHFANKHFTDGQLPVTADQSVSKLLFPSFCSLLTDLTISVLNILYK